jgi:hypothetical protein
VNTEFYKQIEQGTAHRKRRDENTAFVLSHPEYLSDLALIACNPKDKIHYKALWVIELISIEKTAFLLPIVEAFCTALPEYKIEKAIRPSAKICFQLVKSKAIMLTAKQEKQIIETCMDWLIGDAKVAPKAFAMYTLCHFAQKQDWIKEALRNTIDKDFAHQSAGYKAAAREVLKKIKN